MWGAIGRGAADQITVRTPLAWPARPPAADLPALTPASGRRARRVADSPSTIVQGNGASGGRGVTPVGPFRGSTWGLVVFVHRKLKQTDCLTSLCSLKHRKCSTRQFR